jgi:hypothetical protein
VVVTLPEAGFFTTKIVFEKDVDDSFYPLGDARGRDSALTEPLLELCQLGLEVVEFD